jgi:diguanylate cyclase (GGDEF)-like protein
MPTETLQKLLGYLGSEKPGMDALLSCCQTILSNYKFETVFIASGSTPEETPKPVVWLGLEELVGKSLWRFGVEDRIALTQTAFKVVQDVSGPVMFNTHGSLRIQKPGSGIYFSLFTPGRGYLLVGCAHKEARPYPPRLSEELAEIWKELKKTLWDVVDSVLKQQQLEAKKGEEDVHALDLSQPLSPTLTLPENPNLPQRVTLMVDEATRLYNRAFFEESLAVEVERAKRYKRNITLILLKVNPHGHQNLQETEKLAQQATEILVKSLRRIDILCRIETFEFAMLLPDTAHQNGTTIARRVFKQFKTAMGENPIAHLNLSAAEYPLHGSDAKAVLEKAETFMQKAVLAGVNKAVLSD